MHFKDTGRGISSDKIDKIFDLYFSDTPHGMGIGLAFCKQVMQSFSGDIMCEAEAGKFAHFIMCFPLSEI